MEVLRLDVTSAADIAAAQQCGDVSLLIYNAGISDAQGQLPLRDERAWTAATEPDLRASAGWPRAGRRGPERAVRTELGPCSRGGPQHVQGRGVAADQWPAPQTTRSRTQVTGLRLGYTDARMSRGVVGDRAAPQSVGRQALLGPAAGRPEVLADAVSRQVRAGLSATLAAWCVTCLGRAVS
ncbi:short-chain dehydrogenase [Deinococcus hopiensis]|uniref:short-chain dehydrogenase n=1 Tax=Deinococcus hopiensis TaxID=309885 RepID=UPI00111C3DBC|nr:short-chain dehydrogenase [Deinococcus hopiensis]